MVTCARCENPGSQRCSQCKSIYYCSSQCQKADWRQHKRACKLKAKQNEEKLQQQRQQQQQQQRQQRQQQQQQRQQRQSFPSSYEESYGQGLMDILQSNFHGMLGMSLEDSMSISAEYGRVYPYETAHIGVLREREISYRWTRLEEKQNKTNMASLEHIDFAGYECFLKRWGPNIGIMDPKHVLNFIQTPGRKMGDIYERRIQPRYDMFRYQTMRNTSIANQEYQFGRTYVGFGFVDLFQLAWGKYKDTLQERLTFYGYDSNQFTTLRSKMIYGIMKYFKEDEISTSSLLQIWFSSCWSRETEKAFRLVSQDALKNPDKYQLQSGDADIIRKWLGNKVSLNDAKSIFSRDIKPRDGLFEDIWSMKLSEDRVLFSRYLLTGIIFVDDSKVICGNPTMFYQEGKNRKMSEELFFKGIDLLATGFEEERKPHRTMYEFIISITEKIITGFRALIKIGNIECHLESKYIDATDLQFASRIRNLNPYGIDWSNIPDYMEPKEFIKFAKACSVDDTIHYLHFINWIQFVFGACHTDWVDQQRECIKKCQKLKRQVDMDVAKLKKDSAIMAFLDPDRKFNFPLNEINLYLSIMFRNRFEDWFLYDLETGRILNRHQSQMCDSAIAKFFDQSPTTFRSVFSFNDNIKL
ncbi:uncharacterized protein [Clytia hemisphaerica]